MAGFKKAKYRSESYKLQMGENMLVPTCRSIFRQAQYDATDIALQTLSSVTVKPLCLVVLCRSPVTLSLSYYRFVIIPNFI